MYEDYWKLVTKPFEPSVDPRFVFPCPSHQGAVRKLRYAIESRRSAALLVGPTGVGKTLAWQMLSAQLGDAIGMQAHLFFPLLSPREMLACLAQELGATLTSVQPSTDECLLALQTALLLNHSQGKLAVIAVDEAHLLEDAGLLDPLRLLMNLRAGTDPLFTLLFIGQTGALGMMERYNNLDERLELKVQLRHFSSEETIGYIEHRLVTAGASRPLFTPQALELTHQLSGGVPRRVNRICDLALMVGFASQKAEIDARQLHAVHNELVMLSAAA